MRVRARARGAAALVALAVAACEAAPASTMGSASPSASPSPPAAPAESAAPREPAASSALAAGGAAPAAPAAVAAAAGPCRKCGAPAVRARFVREDVEESSGAAASRVHDGVLWTHNDSGDDPIVYAVRTSDGADLGAFRLSGVADAIDWEDMALGPCASGRPGDCLYMADIGDNFRARETYVVHRLPEPAPRAPAAAGTTPAAVDAGPVVSFVFRYPDGAHNAEALFVEPTSARFYVVTKTDEGTSGVYRWPAGAAAGTVATLEHVADLDFRAHGRRATGADIAPDGRRVIVRTYEMALEWAVPPGADLATALRAAPCALPIDRAGQGESVAYAPDGTGYWSTREEERAPLFFVRCE